MNYIDKCINELKQKPLDVVDDLMEIAKPKKTASINDILYSEKEFGVVLPESYKKFIKEYSNGDCCILGIEPFAGVGPITNESVFKLLRPGSLLDICSDTEVLIKPQNKTIKLNQLISFTYGDSLDISNDHWVFICDKDYPNNDYPVGYISQTTKNIVYMLNNFEEWLQIFWEYNKNVTNNYTSVFHIIFPTQDERESIINS